MSSFKYGRYLLGALAIGALPLTMGTALAADGHGPRAGMGPMFTQMDADKDGKVTQAEVEAFNKARTVAIDADKDGKITAAELKAHMEKQRESRMAERLARLDKDGDGAVSVKEFEDAGMWRFARMDRNGDGAIDRGDRGRMDHGQRHRGHRDGRGHR